MIIDLIINILLTIPSILVNSINDLDFNIAIPNNIYQVIKDFTSGIVYVLPVYQLLPIAYAMFGIKSFKILWSLVLRIKSFIPSMGS